MKKIVEISSRVSNIDQVRLLDSLRNEIKIDSVLIADEALDVPKYDTFYLINELKRYDRSVEIIPMISGRDQNLISIQTRLISYSALGIEAVLCLSGEEYNSGESDIYKRVSNISSIDIMSLIKELNEGRSIKAFNGANGFLDFDFYIEPIASTILSFEGSCRLTTETRQKIELGVERFFIPTINGKIISEKSCNLIKHLVLNFRPNAINSVRIINNINTLKKSNENVKGVCLQLNNENLEYCIDVFNRLGKECEL